MKAKPDEWKAWTHYCPLPIVLILVILILPLFCFFRIAINIMDGVEDWWANVLEVIDVMKNEGKNEKN